MNNALDRLAQPRPATGAELGQATAIEQSRAVAEVQAAVVVAQQRPRDVQRAIEQMEYSCRQKELAERAFFSFPRAGGAVSGPSVHLARELARCWTNIQYAVQELRRDDANGISEMQAFAWDLENNARTAAIFIVPHAKDTKNGRKALAELRDVYENNANQGARRVREAIFAVLPTWFTERAKQLCHETLASVSGEELEEKLDAAAKAFARRGVTLGQLETRVGQPRAKWTGEEFAQLDVLFGSIKRGEISVEDAFGAQPLTGADITGPAPSKQALQDLKEVFHDHGITDEEQSAFVRSVVGRDVAALDNLTGAEVDEVIAAAVSYKQPA